MYNSLEIIIVNFKIYTKLKIILFLILFFSVSFYSQHNVYQNFKIDSPQKEKIVSLISDYFNEKKPLNDLFTQLDQLNFKTVDLASYANSLGGSLRSISYDVNILGITDNGKYSIVKCLLYWENLDEKTNVKTITVLGILNLKVNTDYKKIELTNYINYYTSSWKRYEIGNFEFICNSNHPFNYEKAKRSVGFTEKLLKTFGILNVPKYKYYIASNCNEIYMMNGFEYFIGADSNNNICGFIDTENKIIYSTSIYDEMDVHEIVHIINEYFPNGNEYLKIGLSAYINDAGSKNLPPLYHIEKLEKFITEKKMDLQKFEDLENIDEFTNMSYPIGSLICNAIYRKGGIKLLLEYLSENTTEMDDFKKRLIKDFGIKDFNAFFRNEIKMFKNQKKSLLYL